jgi:hypothetical protein
MNQTIEEKNKELRFNHAQSAWFLGSREVER